jgi:cell division protein FtsX
MRQRDCLSGISEVSDMRRDVARLTAAAPLVRSVIFGFTIARAKE